MSGSAEKKPQPQHHFKIFCSLDKKSIKKNCVFTCTRCDKLSILVTEVVSVCFCVCVYRVRSVIWAPKCASNYKTHIQFSLLVHYLISLKYVNCKVFVMPWHGMRDCLCVRILLLSRLFFSYFLHIFIFSLLHLNALHSMCVNTTHFVFN